MAMDMDKALDLVETRMRVVARGWGIKPAAFDRVLETQTGVMSQAILMVMRHPEVQAELVDWGARLVLNNAGFTGPVVPQSKVG